jgi:hypothetical protein
MVHVIQLWSRNVKKKFLRFLLFSILFITSTGAFAENVGECAGVYQCTTLLVIQVDSSGTLTTYHSRKLRFMFNLVDESLIPVKLVGESLIPERTHTPIGYLTYDVRMVSCRDGHLDLLEAHLSNFAHINIKDDKLLYTQQDYDFVDTAAAECSRLVN